MTGRLNGKVALVTGGAVGIGRAIVQRFAAEGATVLVGDIDMEGARQTASLACCDAGQAVAVELDVTQEPSVAAAMQLAARDFGRLDVLVNNAGGSTPHDRSVVELDLDEFWRAIRIDLFGMLLCCRLAIPLMAKGGGGSIVNMG